MALILDKSITGITSVDVSGNTLTTGYTNLNYTDQYGNTHENPYLVVDNVIIDKNNIFCKIEVKIYKDELMRGTTIIPILQDSYYQAETNDTQYDDYFGLTIMENVNIFKAAYDFLSGVYFKNWKTDEV